jgi:uncharacterized protein
VTQAELPLFPLEAPALFPFCAAPLHIFEPRYRALAADALAGERRIGMATVRPEALSALAGDPALFSIGCAGFITEHQRLADGRYLILLEATSRFRILREPARPAQRLYRVAQVELLEELPGNESRARAHRADVTRELLAIAAADADSGTGFDERRLEEPDLARFACEVAHALRLPGPEKQALLEAASAEERLERVAQTLSFYRALSLQRTRHEPTLH